MQLLFKGFLIMLGIILLNECLKTMSPELSHEEYIFCTFIKEKEDITLVISLNIAQKNVKYDMSFKKT
jgi:hypothetical protein